MRTALGRLGKIARVEAVHPALEMRVNHHQPRGASTRGGTLTGIVNQPPDGSCGGTDNGTDVDSDVAGTWSALIKGPEAP
ncbi:hypothetical protein DIPPA_32276 [Diplonema papillatum]|nr:hypothetical protein DIPPA_32276 [Diplonema papillatum]